MFLRYLLVRAFIMTNKLLALSIVALSAFLTGCTQRFSDTNDTLKEAFWGFEDVILNKETIEKYPMLAAILRLMMGHKFLWCLHSLKKIHNLEKLSINGSPVTKR